MVKQKVGYQKDLDKLVNQATKLGIGLAIVSKEALDGFIKKTTKTKAVSQKEAKQAVTDLVNESKRREKQLREKIKELLKNAEESNPLASKKDIQKMKAEIRGLKRQLKRKKK